MKLFVFDIDNTLVSHSKNKLTIPDTAFLAIDLIKKSGNKCLIATGRTYNTTRHLMELFDIKDAVVANGSTVIIDHNVIYDKPINENVQKQIFEEIKEKHIPTLAMDSHDIYIYDDVVDRDFFVKQIRSFIDPMYEGTKHNIKSFDFNNLYNSISFFTNEKIKDYEETSVTMYEEGGFELMDINCSKASGIYRYIDINGIDKKSVYVFGDNYNDIKMFQEFYTNSYVLGNACEEVKSYAKNVCDHIDNDGVYKAVKSILK
ncbi:MAG: Cof-type HAD-IIB family hydrolase [Bacilli bacterium]